MTPEQIRQLRDDYAYEVVNGMDHKTLFRLAVDAMVEYLEALSAEELISEVKGIYPHLLEDV